MYGLLVHSIRLDVLTKTELKRIKTKYCISVPTVTENKLENEKKS